MLAAMNKPPVIIQTIGQLREHGMTMTAYCEVRACPHGERLDLDALIERFGEDLDYVEQVWRITGRLRCRRCGHRGGRLIIAPDNSAIKGTGAVSGPGR